MFKSTLQLTFFSILGISVNFVIQLALSYYFGTSASRDAYYAAMTIPSYAAILFNGSIGMVLIPFIFKNNSSSNNSYNISSETINFCFLLLTGIVIVACIFSYPIVRIIVPVSKPELLILTVHLFRILMINSMFIVLNNLLASEFQSRSSYLYPAIIPLITGIISLISVIAFSSTIGISSLAYGTLAGSVLSFIFLLWNLRRKFLYIWQKSFYSKKLKELLITAVPLFGAGIIFRSTTIFERYFAARLSPGSLSYLGNGNQIILILATLISSGIATITYPLLSRYWTEKKILDFRYTFVQSFEIIILIIFPTITIFTICGKDAIKILFEHGAFTSSDTTALYLTLLGLMGFLLFGSLGNVVSKVLYISNNTKTASLIATFKIVLYVILCIPLSNYYDYVGLAISLSISDAFNIICSMIYINFYVTDIKISYLAKKTAILALVSITIYIIVTLLKAQIEYINNPIINLITYATITVSLFWSIYSFIVKDKYYLKMNLTIKNKMSKLLNSTQ